MRQVKLSNVIKRNCLPKSSSNCKDTGKEKLIRQLSKSRTISHSNLHTNQHHVTKCYESNHRRLSISSFNIDAKDNIIFLKSKLHGSNNSSILSSVPRPKQYQIRNPQHRFNSSISNSNSDQLNKETNRSRTKSTPSNDSRDTKSLKSILHEFYQKTYSLVDLDLKNCFQYDVQLFPIQGVNANKSDGAKEPKREFWTCLFKCPITNHYFQSGSLISNSNTNPILSFKSGNMYYYSKKKDSEEACAAKVLDYFSRMDRLENNYSANDNRTVAQQHHYESTTIPRYCNEESLSTLELDLVYSELIKMFLKRRLNLSSRSFLKDHLRCDHLNDDSWTYSLSLPYNILSPSDSTTYPSMNSNISPNATYYSSPTLPNSKKVLKETNEGKDTDPNHIIYSYSRKRDALHALILSLSNGHTSDNNLPSVGYESSNMESEDDVFYSSPEKECLTYESFELPQEDEKILKLWTCKYQSPFTKECFLAGELLCNEVLDDKSMIKLNDKCCYRTKLQASFAALGRAADCYLFRVGKTPYHCAEEPYHFKWSDVKSHINKHYLNPIPFLKELLTGYNNELNSVSMKPYLEHECYVDTSVHGHVNQYWTAEFKCPVTHEIFSSGTLRTEDKSTYIHHDEKIFYKNKQLATLAAVGKAIDCFMYRGGFRSKFHGDQNGEEYTFPEDKLSRNSHIFCYEQPYDSSPSLDIVIARASSYLPESFENQNNNNKTTPKSALVNRYYYILKKPIAAESFQTTSIDVPNGNRTQPYFTSEFQCPITSEIFSSGTLRYIEANQDDTSPAPMINVDGKIYYNELKLAEQAAAGKAMDYLTLRNFWTLFGFSEVSDNPGPYCEEVISDQESIGNDLVDSIDDEDEYVVHNFSRSGSTSLKAGYNRSGMDLLLEAWADKIPSKDDHTLREKGTQRFANKHDFHESADTWSWAKNWYGQMKYDKDAENYLKPPKRGIPKEITFTPKQNLVSIYSCNAVLKKLGKMNNIYHQPLYKQNDIENDKHVENLATKILTQMLSPSVDMNNSSVFCEPDIDTFNNYIRCLCRSSIEETATAAECLLNEMIEKKMFLGHQLPLPNVETFNNVMYLWSLVPGDKSFIKTAEIFTKLEHFSDEISPNKDSYIAVLSSMAYKGGDVTEKFKLGIATEWLEKMKRHEIDLDTSVYNAPLPLFGNVRKYGDFLYDYNTDDYVTTFKDALRDFDSQTDQLICDANNVEKWMNDMMHLSSEEGKIFVAPNIETYEAVIQSWILTGTEFGISRAEDIALSSINASDSDSEVSPRLATFYPIIAAWAYSGHENGPVRVTEWIAKLKELNTSIPNLKLDFRTKLLPIIAWKKLQDRHMKNLDENEKEAASSKTLLAAKRCSEQLVSFCESLKCDQSTTFSTNEYFDISALQTVMEAWKDASSLANGRIQALVISEMLKVIKEYDDVVESQRKTFEEGLKVGEPTQNAETNSYFMMLLDKNPALYGIFISYVTTIDRATLEDNFHHVERLIRRSEEYGLLRKKYHYLKVDKQYNQKDLPNQDKLSIYEDIINCCQLLSMPTRCGDAVRVIMFVFDRYNYNLKTKRNNDGHRGIDSTSFYMKVFEAIGKLVSKENERDRLLQHIYHRMDSSANKSTISRLLKKITGKDLVDQIDQKAQNGIFPKKRKFRKRVNRKSTMET